MSVIIILLLVSICIAGAFLIAFLWGVKDGQFDDTRSPAERILFDTSASSAYKKSSSDSYRPDSYRASSTYKNASSDSAQHPTPSPSNSKKTNNK